MMLATATSDPIVVALISGGAIGAVVSLFKWRTEKVGVEATASKVATDTAVEIIGQLREDNRELRKQLSNARLDLEIAADKIEECTTSIEQLHEREDWHERRIRELERTMRKHDVPVPPRERI
jgi:DNA repair ATPase RecN